MNRGVKCKRGLRFGEGEGRGYRRGINGNQQAVLPTRVKLTFEGIDGRGGYNRSGEPVPVFYDYC